MDSKHKDIFSGSPKTSPGLSKVKIIFIAILFLIVSALIYSSSFWSQSLNIKEVSVIGNKYYPKKNIVDKVYSQVLSHKLKDVNFGYIRKIILSDPFIKSVDFITTYPEKLIISLTPKYLLAIGTINGGKEYYLTDDGEMIEKGQIKLAYPLPVVDFDKISVKKSKANLVEISDFLKNYYQLANKNGKAEKIWKDKFGICFQTQKNITVRVGNLDNIEEKFLKFETYINAFLNKTDFLPNYIDLRWSNQVVTN